MKMEDEWMRLISQDKKIDIPYSSNVLQVESRGDKHSIIAYCKNVTLCLGNYNLLDNAIDALESVNRAYLKGWRIFQFPKES